MRKFNLITWVVSIAWTAIRLLEAFILITQMQQAPQIAELKEDLKAQRDESKYEREMKEAYRDSVDTLIDQLDELSKPKGRECDTNGCLTMSAAGEDPGSFVLGSTSGTVTIKVADVSDAPAFQTGKLPAALRGLTK